MQFILRLPEVQRRTGRGRSSLYNDIRAGLFPRPVLIGSRAVGFPDHEVDAVIGARIAGKCDDDIRAIVRNMHAARTAGRGVA